MIVRFLYSGYTVRTRSSTVELDGPSEVAVKLQVVRKLQPGREGH